MKLAPYKGVFFSLLALSLASCATDAPPPAPPPPPPPAPAGPPVALAPEISDAASVYLAYVHMAEHISNSFADGQTVQAQLRSGEAYEPKQLARGAVAYGAIVAMQDAGFRAALRAYASDPAARADMVAKLVSDPSYAAGLPSVAPAARRVILALSSDGEAVYKAGAGVKQAAYDVQHQGWSKEFVSDRDGRLAVAKQSSAELKSVQSDESARLLTAALTGQGLTVKATTGNASQASGYVVGGDGVSTAPQAATPVTAAADASPAADVATVDFDRPDLFNQPYTPTVNRALAIAAIAILGEGGPSRSDTLVQMLQENDGPTCMGMSKMMLYQCLAVAKPYYEDVFCLGQHVLMDTGQCIGKMSSNALSFAPVQNIGFNSDGSVAHADAVPYLHPETAAKCKKGKKCKASTTAPAKMTAKATTKKKKAS